LELFILLFLEIGEAVQTQAGQPFIFPLDVGSTQLLVLAKLVFR
jgi:hypothetical protein